jgi:4-amino-4-deoxy-L-arabinose transferase-like glycosyltransferase
MKNTVPSLSFSAYWILSLSVLAVACKNFEVGGLSVDGPLYALAARTAARTGEWFYLQGTVPYYIPFSDHPHLGIWFIALVFKFFPAADWSARIPGILFYFGFLFCFFRFLLRTVSKQVAVTAVLILWSFDRFSTYFSRPYLDAGTLFFGANAIFLLYLGLKEKNRSLSTLGGVSLALSFMTKGLTALGFLPALAWVGFTAWKESRDNRRFIFRAIAFFAIAFALVLGSYLGLVLWNVPEMIHKYWQNQWTNRFRITWDWRLLWNSVFWLRLSRESHFLLFPTMVLALLRRPKGIHWTPWVLFASFVVLYAPADRVGLQYWVMLLPWLAWGLASALPAWKGNSEKLMKGTAVFAWTLFVCVQLVPLRIHGNEEREVTVLQERVRSGRVRRLVLDIRPEPMNFTYKDKYTWYADVPLEMVYLGIAVPPPSKASGYLLYNASEDRIREVADRGWCLDEVAKDRALFLECPRFPADRPN